MKQEWRTLANFLEDWPALFSKEIQPDAVGPEYTVILKGDAVDWASLAQG